MELIEVNRKRRFSRREFLKIFFPIAATVAVATMGSALILSSLFIRQSMRILEENEAERLRYSIRLFSRIHLGSVPAFLSAMEEAPIRDFLYGRDWSIEKPLRGLARIDRAIVGNEFIDSLYLYNEEVGTLSTRSGLEGFDEASDPDLLGFLSRVREYGLSRYVPRKVKFEGDAEPRNLFTVVLGAMPPAGAPIRFAFVANLSERAVRAALSGDEASSSLLYILDPKGRFLSHPDPVRFDTDSSGDPVFEAVRSRGEATGSMIVRGDDGARRIAWWAEHPELGWRFVSVALESAVFAPVMRVRNAVVLISAFVLLSAIAAAYALSFRMSGNERRTERALAFLRGEADAAELRASGLFPSLKFPAVAALFRVDDYRSLVARHGASALHDFRDEFLSILAPRVGPCEALRLTEDTFLVLASGDAGLALRQAASAAGKRLGAGIGGRIDPRPRQLEELPDAYRELRSAYRSDFLRGRGEILIAETTEIRTDELSVREPNRSKAIELDLTPLEKAFRLNDAEDAVRRVDELAAFLRESADPDLFRYAASTLGSRIPVLLGSDAEAFLPGGEEGFRETLSATERLDDAARLLRSAAGRLAERGSRHAERRQRELVAKVKELVDARLSDRSLGTASIAAEVGLSASYLRDLFRRSEGTALLDYVGKARLALARRLLSDSTDSVRSVCDQAGFINYSYFFTYFKKMTGCTPSEYRAGARVRE